MVRVIFTEKFKQILDKIKDATLKNKIIKQIEKIKENPKLGKPTMYARKGTRELYVKPFRLSYNYMDDEDMVYILDLYHKKRQ